MEDKVILCHYTYTLDHELCYFWTAECVQRKSIPLSLPTVWSVVGGNTLDVGLSAEKKG